jgi:hypothetical protein
MANILENIAEIQKIADLAAPKVRNAFMDVLAQIKDATAVEKISKALKAGGVEAVLDAIPLDLITTTMQPDIAKIVRSVIEKAAEATVLPKEVSASLDLTNPEVFEYLQNGLLNQTLGIRVETETAIRDAIARAFSEGIHPLEIAQEIQDNIGLTTKQWAAVDNYEQYIRDLADRTSSAAELSDTALYRLQRGGLRGTGMFDTVAGLTDNRIDQLVSSYADKLLGERAATISRTVTIDASNSGQNALWNQASQNGLLKLDEWEVKWIVADDDRTCPRCWAMDKERRSLDGAYSNGVKRPTLHPN